MIFWRRSSPPAAPESLGAFGGPDVFSSDLALSDTAADEFGRTEFALRIAGVIEARTDPSAFVIGVYGPWGSGKTTVLRFVEARLKNLDPKRFPTVWFNPWRYGSEELIVQGLFETLADTLELSLPRTRDKIGDFLQRAGGATGALSVSGYGTQAAIGTGLSSAGRLLSQRTLESDRGRLNEALRASGKRVVVMIDDVDRLDKNEIVTILRAVKLAADFDNLVYILALDPDKVASALSERYPGQSGADFLDKMVQLPLSLPRVDPTIVRQRLLRDAAVLLDRHGVELPEQETWRLASTLDQAVLPRVRTARDHTRYLNAVEFAVPAHHGEVNPVDIVLLEALRMFYPAAYDMVSRNKKLIIGVTEYTGMRENIVRTKLDAVDEDLGEDARESLHQLLRALFPQFDSVLGNTYHADWEVAEWVRAGRVCTERYFDRFFNYGLPPGDVADADINAVIAADRSDAADLLSALLETGDPAVVVAKLLDRAMHLDPDAAERLVDALTSVAGELPPLHSGTDFSAPRLRGALLAVRLVARLPAEDRLPAAQRLLRQSDAEFATLVLRWLGAASEPTADDALLTGEGVNAAASTLADRLLDLDRDTPLIDRPTTVAPEMYMLVFQHDPERARQQLAAALTDRTRLARLLRAFLPSPSAVPSGAPIPLPPEIENQAFTRLGTVLPADILYQAAIAAPGPAARSDRDGQIIARYGAFIDQAGLSGSAPLPVDPLPTIHSVESGHPLTNHNPAGALGGVDPHNADLAIRVAVLIPATATAPLPQEPPISRLVGQEREEQLAKALTATPITRWLSDHARAFDAVDVSSWAPTEVNGSDFTVLAANLTSSEGLIPVQSKASVVTGASQGGKPVPSLLITLDVTFALLDRDEHRRRGDIRHETTPPPAPAALTRPELIDVLHAALGIINTATKVSELLLPPTPQHAAIGIWVSSHNGLDRVINMSDLRVLGNVSVGEERLCLYRRLGPTPLEQPAEQQPTLRDLAIAVVARMLTRARRRGFEAELAALRAAPKPL